MNFHLMIDDKFIDGFIADMEAAVSGNNVYVYTFDAPSTHVRSTMGFLAPYGSDHFREIVGRISSGDRVMVHWLNDEAARFILSLPEQIEVGAFFWGGDFIEDPFYFFKRELLGPLSLQLYESRLEYPIFTGLNPATALRRLNHRLFGFRRVQHQRAALKRAAVSRLDRLFHWNILDHRQVERLYRTTIEPAYFHYDVGLATEVEKLQSPFVRRHSLTKIWLGNSSTITNNHLEALEMLSHFRDREIEVFCPLSYGDKAYGELVRKRGELALGSKFHALTEYLDRRSYYRLMDGMDVVIMNHYRTQAAGTIWAFMKMGKKIFMDRASTLYQLLRSSGTHVFGLPRGGLKFDDIVEPLSTNVAKDNYEQMKALFSEEKKRASLETLT